MAPVVVVTSIRDRRSAVVVVWSVLSLMLCRPSVAWTKQAETWRRDQRKPSQHPSYSLVTWNILAPEFATESKYRNCNPAYLDWSYRRSRIVTQLISYDADLICLQEVPVQKFWSEIWSPYFEALNYTAVLQNVTRDHPVACAVLIRNAAFRVVTAESRSRALIVVLEPTLVRDKQSGHVPLLFLANVHLEAGRGEDATRFNQIQSLLKRLSRQITIAAVQPPLRQPGPSLRARMDHPRVLLAGDFNMLDNNPIYSLLSSSPARTPIAQRNATTGHSEKSNSKMESKTRVTNVERAPNAKGQLSLLSVPLRELFHDPVHDASILKVTFRGGCVLDYIWASWDDVAPWIVEECVLREYLEFDGPTSSNPSDHMPIGARFQLWHTDAYR